MYESLTLAFHEIDTLHRFLVLERPPIVDEIRMWNLTLFLPLMGQFDGSYGRDNARSIMTLYRESCQALAEARSITSVDMWLATTIFANRSLLSLGPDHDGPDIRRWNFESPDVNPYIFDERLKQVLTLDIPVDQDNPDEWQPRFKVRARGWPIYHHGPAVTGISRGNAELLRHCKQGG